MVFLFFYNILQRHYLSYVWLKLRYYRDEKPEDFEKFQNKIPEIEKLRNQMNKDFKTFKDQFTP